MHPAHVKSSAGFLADGPRGPRVSRLILMVVLLLPVAAAQETLADLEEPHRGTDKVWEVTVTPEEADKARALIYRNGPRSVFGLIVYDASGAEIFSKNGTRGVQTLPALPQGAYRFFVRGSGAFQVTDKIVGRTVEAPLDDVGLAGTDAYVLSPRVAENVTIDGSVHVEWWDLTDNAVDLAAPFTRHADPGGVYILTIRGDEGALYSLTLVEAEAPPTPPSGTPAPWWLALLGLLGVAVARRRAR